MASASQRRIKYVYDLPYFERMELCRILDQHDKWEELGGIHMKFNMMTIQTLRRETLRGNSPTDELLTMWGHKNHTITELFALLSRMQHYQAMLIIKDFVDQEYHRLIYEGEQNLSRLMTKSNRSNPVPPPTPSAPSTSGGYEASALPSATAIHSKTLGIHEHNMNLSESNNELPDKLTYVQEQVTQEEKILNIPPDSNNSNSNGSDAQTVMLNARENRSPRNLSGSRSPNLEHHTPEHMNKDGKVSNASNISTIAESIGSLPHISYKELEIATNGWDPHNILGKGGFGTVYKGIWKNTYVAIKRTRNTETDENQTVQIQQILGELKMLNSYRHDNILPLYGFSIGGEDPCLISQFMPNGSLEDRLLCRQGSKALSWQQRHYIATGTARGLQFLHTIGEKPLIHGDIKSGNILLDSNFEPRIGDFGLAREGPYNHYTHMKVSRVHGTRPYLPDEFLRAKKFSTKVDTYSFGIVLYELGSGLRAYDDQRSYKFLKDHVEANESKLETLIDKKAGPDEHQVYLDLMVLGQTCISRKPKDRPEMVAVLEQLNLKTAKIDMEVRVQSMIRQNSLTPSNPYEQQLIHDYQSQQRRMSTSSNRTPSPQPPTLPLVESNHYPVYRTPSPNNNPFLPHSNITNPSNKENVEIPAVVPVLNSIPPKNEVVNKQFDETPRIAVSPPSDSQEQPSFDSILSTTSNVESGQVSVSQAQDCYNYSVDTVLPLISVLGVKGNVKEEPTELPQNGMQFTSTASSKVPWITEEPPS